jgi:hypothetical protein
MISDNPKERQPIPKKTIPTAKAGRIIIVMVARVEQG